MRTSRSPATFGGFKGVNIQGLYYPTVNTGDITGYDANAYSSAFNASYPLSALDGMKSVGFDHVRLMVNIVPMLNAYNLGDNLRIASYLSQLKVCVDTILSRGLMVNFDLHVSPSAAVDRKSVV